MVEQTTSFPTPPPASSLLAVVFDMDGLMFNTEDLYDQVGSVLLERRGQSFTRDIKMSIMGLPGPRAFDVLRQKCHLEESVEQLAAESDEIFLELLPREIAMMPGLAELLEFFESRNIPKAIATSSSRNLATEALAQFKLEPRFEFVLTGDDIENGKPNPDVYLLAADKLNVGPPTMLVLEDSLFGSQAAVAAGAFTIAVPNTHTAEQDFSHANLRVDSLHAVQIRQLFD